MSQDLTIYCPHGAPISMFVSLSNGERDISVESDIPPNWSVRHDLKLIHEDRKLSIFDKNSTMVLSGPAEWVAFLNVYDVIRNASTSENTTKFVIDKEVSVRMYSKAIGEMWEASELLFLKNNRNETPLILAFNRVDKLLKGEAFPKYKMLAIKTLEDRKKFIMDFDEKHGTKFSVMIPKDA